MRRIILLLLVGLLFSCPSPNYIPTEFQYSEYQCPEPIGLIVRENCRENVIKYQAENIDLGVKGSVTNIATAEGTYKYETKVLQQASEFMQFLKDQQVSLCHDYNTCKLTTQEYRERKDRISKAFTTIYALTQQIKVESLTPEMRKEIINKILSVIDEYNNPMSKPDSGSLPKTEFKPTPTKAISPPNIQSNWNQVSEDQLDEAERQMIRMQKKVMEMQKKVMDETNESLEILHEID